MNMVINHFLRWIRRYKYYGLTLLMTAALIGFNCLASQAQNFVEQAASADSFVDSMGVVTHLRYGDTAYGHYEDIIKPRLQELGIHHIRDGGKDAGMFQKLNDLAKLGVKSTLVMDPRDGIDPSNVIDAVINQVLPSIEAAEGPNEWDTQPQLTYQGRSFPEGVRDYQTGLYNTITRNAASSTIPVLMPSLAFPSNGNQLGYLSSVSMGNMHSYAGGHPPSQDLDTKWIPDTRIVSGSNKLIVATECGWHNALTDGNASQPGISEQASAKYVPRLYLEYFNRGVRRSFLYELINQRQAPDQENNFGLLRADGSRKPAFTALTNFVQLLKDPGEAFQPGNLAYALSGDLTAVNHTLLQKRNGKFYLVLWQDVSSFDLNSKADLNPAEHSITISLKTEMSQANIYRPVTSRQPVASTGSTRQLQVNVPDHPVVVELTPAA
jgi:hypothetical protein